MEALQQVEHRAVVLVQQPASHAHLIVGTDPDEVVIERPMMKGISSPKRAQSTSSEAKQELLMSSSRTRASYSGRHDDRARGERFGS